MARVAGTHGAEKPMPTGLQRRGARYYLRRRVPENLIEAVGRHEIVRALGTSDFREAKRLLVVAWAALDLEFEALSAKRETSVVSPDVPPDDLPRISPTVIALTDLDMLRERQVRAQRTGTLGEFRQQCADALTLYQDMLEGKRQTNEDLRVIEGRRNGIRAFLTGEGSMALSAARRVLVPSSVAENEARASKTTTWEELVAKWAAERKPRAKTHKAHLSVVRQFSEAVGSFPVERLTRKHAIQFKDWLVSANTSPPNIKTKLSRMKTLTNFGYENDLIGVKAFDGIRTKQSSERPRRSYDADNLMALFRGPIHQAADRPVQGRGEAAYWLPLIALYTGARIEEIAGLQVVDLQSVQFSNADGEGDSADFFRFLNDKETQRELKTEQSERLTPIHPDLIALGLLRYGQALEAKGEVQLFPRLTQHASGLRAHKWGQWFHAYLRDDCGVRDRKVVFHSFRHTFKDNCRNSGIPEELQRAIMGHAPRDVADRYGEGFALFQIVAGMRRYRAFGIPSIPAFDEPASSRSPR
ncbi:site-specific integrase [uncultured Brevundimonas sp.]|uniref:site-specific integrase n=1 Tax=uncultured Brevundimonas sp. TaxID=213418 RepID=UPI0025E02A07|nr:site-specific integrase [uncultured Brevundimonas sp.]